MSHGSQNQNLDLEPEVIEEIIKTGTDLRQYSKEVEKKLRECENKSIQDYIKESQNIVNLHNRINNCDNILEVNVFPESFKTNRPRL